MRIEDFIPFIIAFVALIASSIIRRRERKDREAHPEKYQEQEQEQQLLLKELLQSLELEAEEPIVPPPAPKIKPPPPKPVVVRAEPTSRQVADYYEYESEIEGRQKGSKIIDQHLDLAVDAQLGKSTFSDRYKDSPHDAVWDVQKTEAGSTRVGDLIGGLKSKKEAILLAEILGKPKADLM